MRSNRNAKQETGSSAVRLGEEAVGDCFVDCDRVCRNGICIYGKT